MENVSLAGIAVHSIISKLTGNGKLGYEIELCVVEACNNSIEHAYKGSFDKSVEILLQLNPDNIFIEIADWGIPKPEGIKTDFDFDPEDIENLPEGGMGIFLIEEIMDELNYRSENGKNIFTMIKYI